jgi:hypothetical protein
MVTICVFDTLKDVTVEFRKPQRLLFCIQEVDHLSGITFSRFIPELQSSFLSHLLQDPTSIHVQCKCNQVTLQGSRNGDALVWGAQLAHFLQNLLLSVKEEIHMIILT